MTVERRSRGSHGRRRADRKWPRMLRDFWMFAITGLVVLALANIDHTTGQVSRNQHANTVALCTFKRDLRERAQQGARFLVTHPQGFAGIPASTLRASIQNEQRTVDSLRALNC